jgi:hypothetical protein
MANCIDGFSNGVDKLLDRFADMYLLPNRLSKIYGLATYPEDLLFAGLILSGCAVYKHLSEAGFIGICGDKTMELSDVIYATVIPENSFHEVFHKHLVEGYFKSIPRIPTSTWVNLRGRSYLIYLTRPAGRVSLHSTVGVYLPKSGVIEVAKRYGLSPPTINTVSDRPFGETGTFTVLLGTCGLTRSWREIHTNCQSNLTTSEGFCKLLDAVLGIFKDAVEFYGEVLNNGVKFLNLYLLY